MVAEPDSDNIVAKLKRQQFLISRNHQKNFERRRKRLLGVRFRTINGSLATGNSLDANHHALEILMKRNRAYRQ